MNYDEAFVQEVRTNPQDDTPRLIFADYLDEAGDPRGEFIRVQVELSNLPVHDPGRRSLEAREAELLETFGEEWLAPLRELGAQGTSVRCFHKGLIERIKIEPETWLANANELCRISPALHQLQLVRARDTLEGFAAARLPDQITALDLSSNGLSGGHLRVLAEAPWVGQIKDLDVSFNRLQDEAGIVGKAAWPLRRLMLGVNGIGPEGVRKAVRWKPIDQIKSISFGVNGLGDLGTEWFVESPLLTNLEELDLSSNQITSLGVATIAASRSLASLKRLNLRANQIDAAGVEAIRESSRLKSLELVDLRANMPRPRVGDYGSRPGAGEDLLIRFDRSVD